MLANDCPWEELNEDEGRETGQSPVVSINEIQNQAINKLMYKITPIYNQDNQIHHMEKYIP